VFVEKHYPERVAFDMLRQLKKDFAEAHGSEGKTAAENALSKPAKKWMSAVCSKYDDVAAIDKVAGVQAQVDDVKMTMEDNVQQMLRQHEKLEDLEDKVTRTPRATPAAVRQWADPRRACVGGQHAVGSVQVQEGGGAAGEPHVVAECAYVRHHLGRLHRHPAHHNLLRVRALPRRE